MNDYTLVPADFYDELVEYDGTDEELEAEALAGTPDESARYWLETYPEKSA